MIDRIVIRRFKRFQEAEFRLDGGHIVLAGPNNTGKTTVLQALAAWDLAFSKWRELNDYGKHKGAYSKKPVSRQSFSAVSLRAFDLLWRERQYAKSPIEIEVRFTEGWTVPMELLPDTQEQIYVRPAKSVDPGALRATSLRTVLVPAMAGLRPDEALYARSDTVNAYLGQGRPGEILRNMLFEASQNEGAWVALCSSIRRLFKCELKKPEVGAFIRVDYMEGTRGPSFDIASAGSGFQQVLLLLTFLHVRPGAVLLLDEPDAHLHVILQNSIYEELKAVALEKRSQLVIATHSEVIINAARPEELYLVLDPPGRLADLEGVPKGASGRTGYPGLT